MSKFLIAALGAMFATVAWAGQPAGVIKIVNGSVTLERASDKRSPAAGERVEVGGGRGVGQPAFCGAHDEQEPREPGREAQPPPHRSAGRGRSALV